MKKITSIIAMVLAAVLLFQTVIFAADQAENEDVQLSEVTLSEMELFDSIDYSNGNLITEEKFYAILKEALKLHDLELTRYPGTNGYFYFNYTNLEDVRILTISRDEEGLAADIELAWADYYAEVEEYADKQAAAKNNNSSSNSTSYQNIFAEEAEEETTAAETETEAETANTERETPAFDPDKDVENSQDYVISFVLSAGNSEMDQQVMFMVSAIVWCIMNPHFNNTDDAFRYLWQALYMTYGNSAGLAASTIDGIDSSYPFTIPGNATEAWLGSDDNKNLILAITNYAVYDEIVDINTAASGIPSFQ